MSSCSFPQAVLEKEAKGQEFCYPVLLIAQLIQGWERRYDPLHIVELQIYFLFQFPNIKQGEQKRGNLK